MHYCIWACTVANKTAATAAHVVRFVWVVMPIVRLRTKVEIENDTLPRVLQHVLIIARAYIVLFIFHRCQSATVFMRTCAKTCGLTTARCFLEVGGATAFRANQESPFSRQISGRQSGKTNGLIDHIVKCATCSIHARIQRNLTKL